MTSTRFGAPADAVPALQEAWPDLPWQSLGETHGAFHRVLLLPPVAVLRIRTGEGHGAETARECATAAALAGAELPIPRPLGTAVSAQRWSAAMVEHVEGTARDPRSWTEDRTAILDLLEVWGDAGSAHPELADALPSARSWCGGDRWPLLVHEMTAADPEVQEAARRRVDSVLTNETGITPGVVHGDLGPHNILWGHDGQPMLIDTDHAAWADPAIDIAPLLATYSREDLAADVPGDVLARAAAHRRTLSLQVAAAAQLSGDLSLRDHALGNFARRIRRGDPQW